jgi:hypothetical protein
MSRDADDEVEMFVRIAVMCQRFNCLPGPGGVLEQDAYIMMGVGIALDALAEKQKLEQDKKNRQMQNQAQHG